MGDKLAFVLSGGGSRGAIEVGALYALLEHDLQPDLLVGTSIGAVNAAFLALKGFSRAGLDLLRSTWFQASEQDLLPSNYIQLTLRAMLGRSSFDPSHRLREFFVSHGLRPDLCFGEIERPQLIIVSTDLNTGKPVLYGESPETKILDALLVSTALPPWIMPVRKQSQYLMDGGVVSNLPIEGALLAGATRIIALDLIDARETFGASSRFGYFLDRLTYAVEKRQVDLELELAKARGVPVFYVSLTSEQVVPFWDFKHTRELIERGYQMTQETIAAYRSAPGHPFSFLEEP